MNRQAITFTIFFDSDILKVLNKKTCGKFAKLQQVQLQKEFDKKAAKIRRKSIFKIKEGK